MAFTCANCGYRTNEVKGGGAVPTFGTEVVLTAENAEDLKRLSFHHDGRDAFYFCVCA